MSSMWSFIKSATGVEDKRETSPEDTASATSAESSAPSLTFSSFFSNLQNIGEKIKSGVDAVAEKALHGFDQEQQQFLSGKRKTGRDAAVAPWVGSPKEEELKAKILALSLDTRNFLRDPPPGAKQFVFDYDEYSPIAMAVLAEDPRLEQLRFDLVPKKVNEETFWRNYFYRVSLIKQSTELSALATATAPATSPSQDSAASSKPDNQSSPSLTAKETASPTGTGAASHDVMTVTTHATGHTDASTSASASASQSGDHDNATSAHNDDSDAVSDASFAAEDDPTEDDIAGLEDLGLNTSTLMSPRKAASKDDVTAATSTTAATATTPIPSNTTTDNNTASTSAAAAVDDSLGWEAELEKELEDLGVDGDLDAVLSKAGADASAVETGDSWEAEIQEMLEDA